MLKVDKISKSFGGYLALDRVSLEVAHGQIQGIVGPNGAGKSTLFRVLMGQLTADGGQIQLDGNRIDALCTSARQRLGMSFSLQMPSLIPYSSVLENLFLAYCTDKGVLKSIGPRRANWNIFMERCSEVVEIVKLRTNLGILAGNLSHGQRKRLEIACAAIQRPKVLLLDEPAAGIEDKDLAGIVESLQELVIDSSVLYIEHRMEFLLELNSTVSVLHHGQVIFKGPLEEARRDGEVRRAYFGNE